MNKVVLLLAIVSFLPYSCGNSTNKKSNIQTETDAEFKGEAIKLKNNEKWKINEEMTPFILEAKDILSKYAASQSEDYKSLAAQLKEKNRDLIKSCTMKGESHDELHKWLYPHIELIESLSKAESSKEANDIIANLQSSFSIFNQYFQ